MPNNVDRFLVAFARVEDELKKRSTSDQGSFARSVRFAAQNDSTVRMLENDLLEYGELRNAIVHDRGRGYVIADPFPKTVERLERMAEKLSDPPRVEALGLTEVARCAPEERVGVAAKRMLSGGYSQLPVYAEDALINLLTTNALSRWMADQFSPEMNLLEEETVNNVLRYREEGEQYRVVSRSKRVPEIIEMFANAARNGIRLEAVLITQNGKAAQTPLGILTVFDLPRMYEKMEI